MSKITITLAKGCEFEAVPSQGFGVINDPAGKLVYFGFGDPFHPKDMDGKEQSDVTMVECERVLVSNNAGYEDMTSALIASRYSISAELALHRQRDSKIIEFNDYNNYAEMCKGIAKKICKG